MGEPIDLIQIAALNREAVASMRSSQMTIKRWRILETGERADAPSAIQDVWSDAANLREQASPLKWQKATNKSELARGILTS